MLAFTCAFMLVGCGDDGSDGAPGSDADASAMIAELQAQLDAGLITIAEYEAAIAALQADLKVSSVKTESCSTCHDAASIHQPEEHPTVAATMTAPVTGGSLVLTAVVKDAEGEPITGLTKTELATIYVMYDGATDLKRARITSSTAYWAADVTVVETATAGTYTVTLANAETNITTTGGEAFAFATSKGRSQLIFEIGEYEPISNVMAFPASGDAARDAWVSNDSCIRCHGDYVFKQGHHGTNGEDNQGDGYLPVGVENCVTCHSYNDSGHRLTRYVHGIHNSKNMPDGKFVKSSTSSGVTTYDEFEADYPADMTSCVVCHKDGSGNLVASVMSQPASITLCQTCHRGDIDPFDTASASYDADDVKEQVIEDIFAKAGRTGTIVSTHKTMVVTNGQDCSDCHTITDFHSGKSKENALAETIAYKIDSVTVADGKATIKWYAYNPNDDTKYDLSLKTATTGKPLFIHTAPSTDPVVDGVWLLVGYYAAGTNDIIGYDSYYNASTTTIWSVTTFGSDKVATSVVPLSSTKIGTLTPSSTKGIIGIIGAPLVDGVGAKVTSVTKDFNLSTGALTSSTAIANDAKCSNCHDNILLHAGRHTAIGNAIACRICHNPTSSAGHYAQQSRSLKSYVHAVHEGQADSGTGEILVTGYPNTMADCSACHDAGTYSVPNQTKSLGGVVGTLGTSKATTGPASIACLSCHVAYQYVRPRNTTTGAVDYATGKSMLQLTETLETLEAELAVLEAATTPNATAIAAKEDEIADQEEIIATYNSVAATEAYALRAHAGSNGYLVDTTVAPYATVLNKALELLGIK